MSVVAAFAYRGGKQVRPVSLDAPETLQAGEGEFVWIGVVDPSEQELLILQERFDLHPLAVEDALKTNHLPKAEVYGNQLFAIAKTAFLDDARICYGETSAFVGPGQDPDIVDIEGDDDFDAGYLSVLPQP